MEIWRIGLSFRWNGDVRLADLFVFLGFTAASVAAILAYRQFRLATATNRARFLFDVMRWSHDDKELRAMFYRLDYDQWKFDEKTFPLSDDEPAIDQLLMLYEMVGHFIDLGIFKRDEVKILTFEASQVLKNRGIVRYLEWLDKEFGKVGVPTPAFIHARALARSIADDRANRNEAISES